MRKVFLDLGAYYGDSINEFLNTPKHSNRQTFALRDDAAQYDIIAVEPCATNLKLQEHHPNITIIEKVAWVVDGMISFRMAKEGPFTVASCVSHYPFIGDTRGTEYVSMPSFDVAEYIRKLQCDYLVVKMNVESSEYEILPRMLEINAMRKVNELYLEFHHRGDPKYDKQRMDLTAKIKECGVKLYEHWWRSVK
jgi:hypothetical protein